MKLNSDLGNYSSTAEELFNLKSLLFGLHTKISIPQKLYFLETFGYRYLNDKSFRKEVDKKVLVFEKNNYIGYADRNNFHGIGNPENSKRIIQIGELPMINSFYSTTNISYSRPLKEMKNGDFHEFPHPNHYMVNVKTTHLNKLISGKFTNETQIFDSGNQITKINSKSSNKNLFDILNK